MNGAFKRKPDEEPIPTSDSTPPPEDNNTDTSTLPYEPGSLALRLPVLPQEGAVVSNYQILEKLGTGGMGVIFKALDTKLKRLVALKFLSPELSKREEALGRFHREAEAASALNHPNICTVHDVVEHDGQHFIVMELLDGRTLCDHIGRQPLPRQELLSLSIQMADALEAAHANGILHRDIKPSNIFVTARGQIKVVDFGLAKLFARPLTEAAKESELTQLGAVVGTIAYMSPEQARGQPVDLRTDIFSLGSVLYEMATGVQPFRGRNSNMVIEAILHYWPSPPVAFNPDLPAGLDRIINKALKKDPSQRYQTIAEMKAELQQLKEKNDAGLVPAAASVELAEQKRKQKRRRIVTLGAVLLLLVVAEVLAFTLMEMYRRPWQTTVATTDADNIRDYLAKIENAPTPAQALGLVAALQKLGQEEQAYAALHRFAGKREDAAEAHLKYAKWLVTKKRYAEAVTAYEALLKVNPADVDSQVAVARIYSWQKEYDRALMRYEKILQLHPANYDARVGKAFTLIWMGRRNEARTLLEAAILQHPGDAEVAAALKSTSPPSPPSR